MLDDIRTYLLDNLDRLLLKLVEETSQKKKTKARVVPQKKSDGSRSRRSSQ